MVIILMGAAGAGKTTVGKNLAEELHWRFCDGDALHPPENVEKMRAGLPLTDEDRRPWLKEVRKTIQEWVRSETNAVLACSLLKHSYRTSVLEGQDGHVTLVYLKVDKFLLQQRLATRTGHFLRADLLDSQLQTLEEPAHALVIDGSATPPSIVRQIRSAFQV